MSVKSGRWARRRVRLRLRLRLCLLVARRRRENFSYKSAKRRPVPTDHCIPNPILLYLSECIYLFGISITYEICLFETGHIGLLDGFQVRCECIG